MQSLSNFPVELKKMHQTAKYETEEERNQIVEFLAERISVLLSECLTQKWRETQGAGHMFYGDPKNGHCSNFGQDSTGSA